MRYPLIQPMAFRLDALTARADTWPDELRTAYAMRLPTGWRETLAPLALRTPRGGDQAYDTLPIRTLNRAIRALLPDIMTVTTGQHARSATGPWLFSRAPIAPQAIRRVVVAWAQSPVFAADDERKLQAAQQLLPDDLVWKSCDLAASRWTASSAGTALPPAERMADPFRLLPELLAARVTSRPFQFGDERVGLRRATLPQDKGGVELISWPPLWGQARGKSWPYSFVITLTLQTAPFEGAPLLYADLGVRRWVVGKLFARNAMAFLATQAPWVEDAPATPYFGVARMIRERDAKGEWGWAWDDALPSILDRLKLFSSVAMPPFPSAATIAERPEVGLELPGELSGAGAAIMYHTGMASDHHMGIGFLPDDRAMLIADQLASALAPYCPLVEPLMRVAVDARLRPAIISAQPTSHAAQPAPLAMAKFVEDQGSEDEGDREQDELNSDAEETWDKGPLLETQTSAEDEGIASGALEARLAGLALRQPIEREVKQIAKSLGMRMLDASAQATWESAITRVGDHVGIVLACQSGVTQLALVTALRARLGPLGAPQHHASQRDRGRAWTADGTAPVDTPRRRRAHGALAPAGRVGRRANLERAWNTGRAAPRGQRNPSEERPRLYPCAGLCYRRDASGRHH